MEDKAVLERISGLKGRLGYEEKKAKKLGFASIYEYMEDKINNENQGLISVSEVSIKPTKSVKKKKKLHQRHAAAVKFYLLTIFIVPSYKTLHSGALK